VGEKVKKIVKTIKVDLDKCNGCRGCEMACSAYHATPKYSAMNPSRARIRVHHDPFNDEFVPIRATDYSKAGCDGRRVYTIKGKQYSECSFCGTICPTREMFYDPDSGLPLKCDLCEDEKEPLCVQACPQGCLTYEEVEEVTEDKEEIKMDEMEIGMRSLLDKFGVQKIADAFNRLSTKG